jgi:hypothetical protein
VGKSIAPLARRKARHRGFARRYPIARKRADGSLLRAAPCAVARFWNDFSA